LHTIELRYSGLVNPTIAFTDKLTLKMLSNILLPKEDGLSFHTRIILSLTPYDQLEIYPTLPFRYS